MACRLTQLAFLAFLFPAFAYSQAFTTSPLSASDAKDVATAKGLAEREDWDVLLSSFPAGREGPAELSLYRGMALARIGRLEDARLELAAGAARQPRDRRYALELAGVAYKQGDFRAAKANLARYLSVEPGDAYANDFLGSIFFLEGNLEASLKYWNRAGKPLVSDLNYDPEPRLKAALLDEAFRFSPAEPWTLADYRDTRARIDHLGIFSREEYELRAREDGTFDMTFRASERNSWGASTLAGAFSMFRDIPFQTVRLELSNLGRAAVNWHSLYRWNDQRRRLFSEVSTPIGADPSWRFRTYVDGRNENWNITESFLPASSVTSVNLERGETGIEILSVVNGRWSWAVGVGYSYRRYRNPTGVSDEAAPFFENGSELHLRGRIQRLLWSMPEKRWMFEGEVEGQVGRNFMPSLGAYGQTSAGIRWRWLPGATDNIHEINSRLRAGRTFGDVSFDQLYSLGFERDNDLRMRGHRGVRDGQKGLAPLGTSYILWNLNYVRKLFDWRFTTFSAGPFLDSGRTFDSTGFFGSRHWLWDVGAQVRVRAFDRFELVLGYGRDLRTGNDTWFAGSSR
jgi:tetratricopeptide (TPR) repeat protein